MPKAILELSGGVSLHDALVDRVVWDRGARRLAIELVESSGSSECFGVRLEYFDAQICDRAVEVLSARARDRRTQVLYDEVDQDGDDESWVHRLLFWPEGEVSIFFRSLGFARTARVDSKWAWVGCDPFIVVDEADRTGRD